MQERVSKKVMELRRTEKRTNRVLESTHRRGFRAEKDEQERYEQWRREELSRLGFGQGE